MAGLNPCRTFRVDTIGHPTALLSARNSIIREANHLAKALSLEDPAISEPTQVGPTIVLRVLAHSAVEMNDRIAALDSMIHRG